MSRRWVATTGSAVTFVLAGAGGAAGGLIGDSPVWATVVTAVVLLAGGGVTGWMVWRLGPEESPASDPVPPGGGDAGRPGVTHRGDNHVSGVSGSGDGPVIGVNYGPLQQPPRSSGQ